MPPGSAGTSVVVRCDVVIVGGGVAGLWTRFALRSAGYSVVLLESRALGAGQTIASQGILHRGVKYAIGGSGRASRELLEAQQEWVDALEGRAGPDLRGVRILAPSMHLWSEAGLLGRFTGAIASLAIRSQVQRLEPGERLGAFAGAPENVPVWRVQEQALEAATLLSALKRATDGPVVAIDPKDSVQLSPNAGGVSVQARSGRGEVRMEAGAAVLAAGAGNEPLLRDAGVNPEPLCQRRPLHMVAVRDTPADLFGHCIQELSDKPRLTVTTGGPDGRHIWYIGGDIAEKGVARSRDEQVGAARAELAACLPWLDTRSCPMAAFRIDRAEGKTPDGARPDGPVVHREGRILAVWPTKLALAPRAGSMVAESVRAVARPQAAENLEALRDEPSPDVATPPWEDKDLQWT